MTNSKEESKELPSDELANEFSTEDLNEEDKRQLREFEELFEEILDRPDRGSRIIVTKLPRKS